MTPINGRLLYVDLDDVLGDFAKMFLREFGVESRAVANDVLWQKLHDHPSFFVDMDPSPGALTFFEHVRPYRPVILTACSETHYVEGATQKRAWVRKHLGNDVMVLPCRGGKFKHLFMHAPGDVLVDDFDSNIRRWEGAGGQGILHVPHDWQSTLDRVHAAMRTTT